MTWISLVCLLALSSAAFGQSNYGGYSDSSLFKPKPVVPAPLPLPTPVADIPLRPAPVFSNNYGSYDKFESRKLSFDLPKPATLPLSEADILCKGKPEGHIIVLLAGEKFVICTTDSKGDEFFCPKGLLYNDETKRCERKFNPNKNPCASQPCLNGGRCIPTQYTYQCECSQGFSGRTCELDASVCQQQQPCGQSFDSFCQSFLVGSALKHVCILQDGRSYGLTGQQTFSNPCLTSEGIHPLAFGNKGFIMCDGDSMFVESCPGETIWDPLTKVCSWADLPTQPVPFGLGFSAPLALPRLSSEPENRAASEASVESSNIDIETPTTTFSRVVAPMSVLPGAVRGGGGGGGGGGDFLRRNFESSSFQPSVGFSGSLGGSGDDFQRRTFSGGVFRPSSETGGVIRGPGGLPTDLPLPGRAGATSATESVGEFDNFRRRNIIGDDSDSSSIPFSPRPILTNPSRSPGEIDRSSFFINRPGASSSGLNLFTRRNRF